MQNSKIEWTTHTFNPWHGCFKVSPGCTNCYAETLSKRLGRKIWGPAKTTARMGMSDNYWKQPARWNAAALKQPYGSERPRVFCASMADVFEDHPQVAPWRTRLWETIGECDALDWLLLTKRPENVLQMVPPVWVDGYWPDHVWLGTSVENQEYADRRIPELLRVPARARFLSCEPLLGPVDLSAWLICERCKGDGTIFHAVQRGRRTFIGRTIPCPACNGQVWRRDISWVIAGGESGPRARPAHPDWFRRLRDDCQNASVAYFFKQHGEYVHADDCGVDSHDHASLFCASGTERTVTLYRVGKHAAGRLLDGREWNEVPA